MEVNIGSLSGRYSVKVNLSTQVKRGSIHNKTLTNNLCGLDVPLRDQLMWRGWGQCGDMGPAQGL